MLPRHTIFDTPVLRAVLPPIARFALALGGWRLHGTVPAIDKCVIIAAPHTSNWDFPVMMAYVNFEQRIGGVGPMLDPCGDLDADMARFRAFYANIRGKHSHLETPVRIYSSAQAKARAADP